jgi:asparagine synthase (glutamine-hydrolysing)
VCDVDAVSARQLFADYRRVMDQPSIDGMNTLAVSQLAGACGLKVMLSGLGADELFGGYPSFSAVPQFAAVNRWLSAAGPLRTVAGRWLERLPDPRYRRIGDMLGQEPGLPTAYAAYRGIFTRAEARALTTQFGCGVPDEAPAAPLPDDPTPQDAACRLEMTRYLRNQLLRDTDVMSMACGVEVRVPFIDERVVRTLTSIPPSQRLRPQKALLRHAVPEIPEWISTQPKRGFMFPIAQWLGGEWGGVFDDTDARCVVPTQTWYRQWCVHAFQAWVDQLHETAVIPEAERSVAAARGANG